MPPLVRALLLAALLPAAACAEVKVAFERSDGGFKFESVPRPVKDDAASTAVLTIVDGDRDRNGGALSVLQDDRVPLAEDEPSASFFFRAGTDGGRLLIDLKSVISISRVGTYSWHTGSRAPQVYTLFGADGTVEGFQAGPKRSTDPETCGWTLLAKVDTRDKDGEDGGQQGAAITGGSGSLGSYRYLLFDISQTEDRDPFGNTFFSEVDVIRADAPAPAEITTPIPVQVAFDAADGKYQFTVDLTHAPDLEEWVNLELKPVVREWYPKIVEMLPSEGFEARSRVLLRFRTDMRGTPASAGGNTINLNADWFRREKSGQALGAVVHEIVHIVQDYGRGRRGPNAARTPGWVVEGTADYVRWFLYEPQSKGAEITRRNLDTARYDASYRVTGNFLDWVAKNHEKDLLQKLNAAAREGRYADPLWKEWTGKSLEELGEAWKAFHQDRLSKSE